MGVTSLKLVTSRPAALSALMDDSRPAPGPLTLTSTRFTPFSSAFLAHVSAACWAANGVLLREPENPREPALDQHIVLPLASVIVTIVLLNVVWIWAIPWLTLFFSFFFVRDGFAFCLNNCHLTDWTATEIQKF